MTEINNNIHNYGYQVERINTKNEKQEQVQSETPKETEEKSYAIDTGVLGRSQILNGGNITKSVNEAVDMAENCPTKLGCSEYMFDTMYEDSIKAGNNESDAYIKALLGEDEFLEIASKYKK